MLRGLNLCRYCVDELQRRRDGRWACRGCGTIAPEQLKEHGGFCARCVCQACGKPDPESVHETGLCRECRTNAGVFCL